MSFESLRLGSQKRKYFDKELTEEGLWALLSRMYQASDAIFFDTYWLSLMEMLLSLSLVADFGLGLTDFPLFDLEFEFELPSIDDFLKGTYFILEELSLEDIFEEFYGVWEILDWDATMRYFFKFPIPPLFPGAMFSWAIYEVTNYDESYYAPADVSDIYSPEFWATFGKAAQLPSLQPLYYTITNVLLPMVKEMSSAPHVKALLTALSKDAKTVNVLATRVDLLEKVLENGLFLGFNLLGYSKFAPKVEMGGKKYAKVDLGNGKFLYLDTLDRLLWGFILGVTPLGFGRFVPAEYTVFRETAPHFARFRAMKQFSRFISPWSPLLFRETPERMRSVHTSRRAHKYGAGRAAARVLARRIWRMFRDRRDAFYVNSLVRAAFDAAFALRVGHRRSQEWKAQLSDERFKEAWMAKWAAMGLDRGDLERVWEVVVAWRKAAPKALPR